MGQSAVHGTWPRNKILPGSFFVAAHMWCQSWRAPPVDFELAETAKGRAEGIGQLLGMGSVEIPPAYMALRPMLEAIAIRSPPAKL